MYVLWVAGVDLDGGVLVVHDAAVEGRVLTLHIHRGDTEGHSENRQNSAQHDCKTRLQDATRIKDTTSQRFYLSMQRRGDPMVRPTCDGCHILRRLFDMRREEKRREGRRTCDVLVHRQATSVGDSLFTSEGPTRDTYTQLGHRGRKGRCVRRGGD